MNWYIDDMNLEGTDKESIVSVHELSDINQELWLLLIEEMTKYTLEKLQVLHNGSDVQKTF